MARILGLQACNGWLLLGLLFSKADGCSTLIFNYLCPKKLMETMLQNTVLTQPYPRRPWKKEASTQNFWETFVLKFLPYSIHCSSVIQNVLDFFKRWNQLLFLFFFSTILGSLRRLCFGVSPSEIDSKLWQTVLNALIAYVASLNCTFFRIIDNCVKWFVKTI